MSKPLIMAWLLILTVSVGYGFIFATRMDDLLKDQAALNIRLEALEERLGIESTHMQDDNKMMEEDGAMMDDDKMMEEDGAMMDDDKMMEEDRAMMDDDKMMEEDGAMMEQ